MRARALQVLQAVEAGTAFAEHLLGPDDPPFVRELVLGVLRRRATLDAVYGAYGRRPVDELDPPVRAAIRLGLYQLLFLDGIPPHAAVSETVGAVKLHSQRSYLNGVLRRIAREAKIVDARFDSEDNVAEVDIRFVGELVTVVRDSEHRIVEGDPNEVRRETDVWTFGRKMGAPDPNWLLIATGE